MVEETPIYTDGTIAYDAGIQWVYQPGAITPAARYQRGKLHYVVTDHQGTPREMFTENGVASWAGRLNTWGQLAFWESREGRAENDPNYIDCHFRFAGQFEDNETGLYYNRFRYYDKDSGQYISPDPIGLLGGFNPYGYVHDPVGFIDPFGLACCPPKVNAEHVFHGEINRRGNAVGFHHEASIGHQGKARISEITDLPNAQGVYRGKVEIFNAQTGQWVQKGPESSFFPKSWSRQQVMSEIKGAYQNSTIQGSKWEGVSPSGVKIGGYLDKNGNINTAFPVYEKVK